MARLFACLLLFFASTAFASQVDLLLGKSSTIASAVESEIAPNDERDRLIQRLELAQKQLTELDNNPQAPDRDMNRFWITLSIYAYQQHIAALEGLDALKAPRANNQAASRTSNSVQLQQERQIIEQEINVLSSGLKAQETYLNTIHDELEQAQAELRLVQGQFEKAPPQSTQRSQLASKMALAQRKVATWLATLASIDARQQFNRARLQERREQILTLNNQIGNDQTKLQSALLDANLQAMQDQQQKYTQQQSLQLNREQELRRQLAALKQQREALQTKIDNPKTKHPEQLQAQLQALDQQEPILLHQLETLAIQTGILTDLMMVNTLDITFWKKRQALANNHSQTEVQSLNAAVEDWLVTLRDMQNAAQKSANIAQDQLDQLQKIGNSSAEVIQAWQEREQIYRNAATDFRHSSEKYQRWISDASPKDKTLAMRSDYWQGLIQSKLTAIWNYELFSVNDSVQVDGQNISLTRGVTVGKVCIALLLITVGFALCILSSNLIERLILKYTQWAEISVRIAKRWLLSVAFIILLINSLLIVQIPLAAFAFLGGAIAIGLGFGMQTLLKNLISGLMMLLERPFRPGDTIEVAGIRGTIVDMSVRAAVVRDVNGIDTLVPNSTFLEQNVTNWSYTTSIIRQGFQVGVAYGSDLRLVAKLLEEEVKRHGQIVADKNPEILLENFAADALTFGVYYWIDIGAGIIGRQVASDLRFMIEASFRKHGICIAFPQRDVHLDLTSPVRVQLETTSTPPNTKHDDSLGHTHAK
ncbi:MULTISPECIES: mechanosensitive ion channel domain-containing protein [Deefgea]|uniref:Mechanosensitive ion channel n=1 Tax=Deefgea chitinilytica TaxID=570276 RepID=A0ABS2CB15_9NEIS|nr:MULTISPECIES: mechanosensitive ion channel domain-containing protein [Deefgea]MBM5571257.1 mechanosensitive ion channel [Deefgea chitinilytica]MBM9888489.1 mechanosensitive ion channel [Deefgea sp. CFH1-16]